MNKLYFRTKNSILLHILLISTVLLGNSFTTNAQICGTPGVDGPANISSAINTYYPIKVGEPTLNSGAQAIKLGAVPSMDAYGNNFGTTPISAGDLILIIQMQDAEIDYSNSKAYGSGVSNFFTDSFGGTGFTKIGNTGVFEYVIATNSVPLTGGNLTFKGTGNGGGVKNSFYNAEATSTRGKRTFQIIRLPQYSNLTLTSNITTPPFNGTAGGVIAFSVSGNFDFNGKTIDGNARGFRGGYSPVANSDLNNSTTYVGVAANTSISGKGEGIAGTPRFMYDGYNQVDNLVEGMPGGSAGRGAPANAGGGGNDHNAGGGGGGNGGNGGLGGIGWQGANGDVSPLNSGGRPGFKSYLTTAPLLNTLIMGGGGGAGDANNAINGVKGGVGGAIILINAGSISGTGFINTNGGNGAAGVFADFPDGAGGGGAGGSVLLNIANSSNATITIEAKGGNGGNTFNDGGNEHGPGGGGGGGIIRYNAIGATINSNVTKGIAGKTNNGNNPTNAHGAIDGTDGYKATFVPSDLNPELQITANCFPILETNVESITKSLCNSIGNEIIYEIKIKNTGNGNAAGVVLDFAFPTGIEFTSATAIYSTGTSGPSGLLSNINTPNNPLFGGFNIALNSTVTITLKGKLTATANTGINNVSAQALYLDPTRTIANPNRKITAFTNSYGSAIKTYEGSNASNVPGINFNGVPSSITIDDVTIWALPEVPTTNVTQPSCSVSTGEIKVISPASSTGITYTLIGINPVVAAKTNATGIFSGLVAGSYVITTTNVNSCNSIPTDNIIINAVVGAPTTTGVSICEGGSGSLSATGCSDSSDIKWYTDPTGGTPIFTGSSFNPIGVLNSGLTNTNTPSTTTFYAECNDSGCRAATNFVINPVPTINTTTPGTNCGPGTVILGATASTGTINWYDAATGGTLVGTGINFATPNLTVSRTYYVDVTANGCTSSRLPVVASINNIPTITNNTPNKRCGAGTVELKATASSGTVNWYSNAQGGTKLAEGNTFITPNISSTTTYYVDATDNNCTSSSRIAVAAIIEAAPAAPTATNQTVCTDGTNTQTLTATATGGTITWYTDATAGTVVNIPTQVGVGTTTYYAEASNGTCSSLTRTPVILTISSEIAFTATPTQPKCAGEKGTVVLSTPTGGTGNIIFNSTATADLAPGNYTYTATDANGCTKSITVTINVAPDTIAFTATPTQPKCFGDKGSVVLSTPTGGTGNIIFNSTATADLAPGNYTYTATDANGCTKSITVTINAAPDTIAFTATPTQPKCFGDKGSVVLSTPTGGTGNITFNSTATADLAPGNYTYTATDANGCTISITVTINAAPDAIAFTATPTQITYFGGTGSVTLNTNGGTGTYTYNPANPATTNLTAGTYIYKVIDANGCEATARVTINNAPEIDAVNDLLVSSNGTIGNSNAGNVLLSNPSSANTPDTVNGTAATINQVNLTIVTPTTPNIPGALVPNLDVTTGQISVPAGTLAGSYSIVYKICDKQYPDNCDSATVTIPVNAPLIEAIDDIAPTAVNGFDGGIAFTNILVNDKLNGVILDPAKVNTTFVSSTNTGITLVGTNVVVAPGTPAGDYELVYKICEKLNANNCDEATVKVKVAATTIEAIDDIAPAAVNGFDGGIAFTNVLVNDKLNGVILDPAKVNTTFVSSTNTGITLVGTNVVVAPGTPAGDYELVYKICEKLNANNCDEATVKVKVAATTIEAIDDIAPAAVNGFDGGIAFTNVLVNDKLNGVILDPAKVNTTFVSSTNTGITLVGTNVVVAPGTPAGDYELVYKICEKLNTNNCDDAIVKVSVYIPSISITKDGTYVDTNNDGKTNIGDVVSYKFVITNTGNVALTNVTVTDNNATVSGGPIAILAPGATDATTFTASHAITQNDIDKGIVYNVAIVKAKDPKGNEVTDTSSDPTPCTTCPKNPECLDCTITELDQQSSIALVKTASISGTGVKGDVITYTFTVTNTGNTSLTNVVITDPMVGLTITGNPIATLAVGASTSVIKGTYTITQADIDAGKVTNTALATAKDPKGNNVTDISGTQVDNDTPTTIPLAQTPKIALVKTASVSGTGVKGDVITYTFTVTNTGNTSLTNVVVTDPMVGLTITGNPIATLAVGASTSVIKGTYTITQADIDAGKVTNTALATAKDPKGNNVTDTSGTVVGNDTPTTTPLAQNPGITVVKTANKTNYDTLGEIITYSIVVTNTGNVNLHQVVVSDPLTGLNSTIENLTIGESKEFTENYTVTQTDLGNETITNIATATGLSPNNVPVSNSDTVVIDRAFVLGCGTILVHNAFTPNGDGTNDNFVIDNIDDTLCYPENSVEIYNRWGILVYETKGYDNNSKAFKGYSEGRVTVDKSAGLPTGTYFYILNYTAVGLEGEMIPKKQQGYLYLTR